MCLATSPHKWCRLFHSDSKGKAFLSWTCMRWWIHSFGTRQLYLKDSLYCAEYPNELSRVVHQCGSDPRRPYLFSLDLLSFVEGAVLAVDSRSSSFPPLNKTTWLSFYGPSHQNHQLLETANTTHSNLIFCLHAYQRVSPGKDSVTSKIAAENTNLKAWGLCFFVKFAMFNDPQTTGESIWI